MEGGAISFCRARERPRLQHTEPHRFLAQTLVCPYGLVDYLPLVFIFPHSIRRRNMLTNRILQRRVKLTHGMMSCIMFRRLTLYQFSLHVYLSLFNTLIQWHFTFCNNAKCEQISRFCNNCWRQVGSYIVTVTIVLPSSRVPAVLYQHCGGLTQISFYLDLQLLPLMSAAKYFGLLDSTFPLLFSISDRNLLVGWFEMNERYARFG